MPAEHAVGNRMKRGTRILFQEEGMTMLARHWAALAAGALLVGGGAAWADDHDTIRLGGTREADTITLGGVDDEATELVYRRGGYGYARYGGYGHGGYARYGGYGYGYGG